MPTSHQVALINNPHPIPGWEFASSWNIAGRCASLEIGGPGGPGPLRPRDMAQSLAAPSTPPLMLSRLCIWKVEGALPWILSVSVVCILEMLHSKLPFPSGSDGKEPACNVGDPGSIPGSGRSPGEGIGNLLPYSCQENPMDGGAWWPKTRESQRVGHD